MVLRTLGSGTWVLDSVTSAVVGQFLAERGQSVLTVGVLHRREHLGPLAHEVTAAAAQVPGGPHLRRIEVGLRQHPAAHEPGNLGGGNLVVLGLAARERLPRESVPEDKGKALLRAEVRQPGPPKEALDGDDQLLPVRGNDP
jgi:hypothetical protein